MHTPDDTTPLTPRQQAILEFIRQTIAEDGAPPTRQEICRAFQFASPNAAEKHLKALVRKGVLSLEGGGLSRGIRLNEVPGIPLVGSVAAGAPILAQEHVISRHRLDSSLFSPAPDFLLRVKGMSMLNAGILDGDLLAVHKTDSARDGQIVVARLDDEVTVKRLQRRPGGQVELIAENPDYPNILVDPDRINLAIEGIAVGLIRGGFPT